MISDMKHTKLVIAFLLIVTCSYAQDTIAIKYANTITKEGAFKRLSILASDAFEGRGTGQPGAEKAAQYIQSQFESFGLIGPVNNTYFQQLDLQEISPLRRDMVLNRKPLTFLQDFYVLPTDYRSLNATYHDFVFVGFGISASNYDDLSNLDLKGKVAVVLPGEPMKDGKSLITGTSEVSDWTRNQEKKLNALTRKNPAAILFITPSMDKMRGYSAYFNNPTLVLGHQRKSETPISIYVSANLLDTLLTATGNTVAQLLESINASGKPNSFNFKNTLKVAMELKQTFVDAKNVLGFLEGSDPTLKKELLVITAHYDHLGVGKQGEIFNGADDDGSGTTAVLELAETFAQAKKEGNGPRRSILFMTVVGEEKGLLGSEWYSENPVFPLENTVANLNIDMIGRVGNDYKGKADSANYIYVIGSGMLSSTLKQISENTNNIYSNLVLDYKYDDPKDPNRFYYRSDHYNFAKHQIPIIFYFNGIHEDYHKPTDEIKKINFPLLTKRAQLVFYTAWELANRDKRPAIDTANERHP